MVLFSIGRIPHSPREQFIFHLRRYSRQAFGRIPRRRYLFDMVSQHMSAYFMLNLKVHEECHDRPDISGTVLANNQSNNIVCVCEVKGEGRVHDTHATLCDLIKIECFSADVINAYSNKRGSRHTFGR
ncbi:uncharacterized protein EV154DRAFT_484821 [Mucor mucedo]|uniref:uncharacterized protein n=1 Tax=Mucor mucedo TaxID=29922 RepID=UPI00221F7D1E|nr:uncharacterized protein EV154DRAFT_484821 [Mucor mucedo]KAI7887731.1 hypothetical protein EV154DRAFT_484821 [Mucor mucedo]